MIIFMQLEAFSWEKAWITASLSEVSVFGQIREAPKKLFAFIKSQMHMLIFVSPPGSLCGSPQINGWNEAITGADN